MIGRQEGLVEVKKLQCLQLGCESARDCLNCRQGGTGRYGTGRLRYCNMSLRLRHDGQQRCPADTSIGRTTCQLCAHLQNLSSNCCSNACQRVCNEFWHGLERALRHCQYALLHALWRRVGSVRLALLLGEEVFHRCSEVAERMVMFSMQGGVPFLDSTKGRRKGVGVVGRMVCGVVVMVVVVVVVVVGRREDDKDDLVDVVICDAARQTARQPGSTAE